MKKTQNARFTLDFVNKSIVGSKASFKLARKGNGTEYEELAFLIARHPDFSIVEKSVKKSEKNTYHGLNLAFMEEYINIQENASKLMDEYNSVKKLAKEAGRSVYPIIKKWFLNQFTEFDMTKAKEEIDQFIFDQAKKATGSSLQHLTNYPSNSMTTNLKNAG